MTIPLAVAHLPRIRVRCERCGSSGPIGESFWEANDLAEADGWLVLAESTTELVPGDHHFCPACTERWGETQMGHAVVHAAQERVLLTQVRPLLIVLLTARLIGLSRAHRRLHDQPDRRPERQRDRSSLRGVRAA